MKFPLKNKLDYYYIFLSWEKNNLYLMIEFITSKYRQIKLGRMVSTTILIQYAQRQHLNLNNLIKKKMFITFL